MLTAEQAVAELEAARRAKAEADERLGTTLRETVRYLVEEVGLSQRYTGKLIGVSSQRVCQLVAEIERTGEAE